MLSIVAPAVIYSVLGILLLVAVYTDFRWGRIRNWATLPAVVLGLGLNAAFFGLPGLERAGEGLGLALAFSLVLSAVGRLMGAGDMKFLMAIGALAGPHVLVWSVAYGALAGAVAAIVVACTQGQLRRDLAMLFSSLVGRVVTASPLDYKTSRSTRFPYAIPLAAGVVMTLVAQGGVMVR